MGYAEIDGLRPRHMQETSRILKALRPQQTEEYERDGVCFPIDGLSRPEVDYFMNGFRDLQKALGDTPEPLLLRHWHLHVKWARELALHPRILDAIEDVVGPDIIVHSSTMFCKEPGDSAYVSWHQDGHYWELSEPRLASAWIALSDSNTENGCMRVLRGSHRQGRVAHAESSVSGHNMLTSGLEVSVPVDRSRIADVVLRAGQFSLHHVNIVHGSEPNRSGGPRVGYAIRYAAPAVRQTLPHVAVLLARGLDRYNHYDHYTADPPPADMAVEALREFSAYATAVRERRHA